ncbi:hypothetical protein TeGR_g6216, partial [Tetraparma gracilis]
MSASPHPPPPHVLSLQHDRGVSEFGNLLIQQSRLDEAAALPPLLHSSKSRLSLTLSVLRASSSPSPAVASLASSAAAWCSSDSERASLRETLRIITIAAILAEYASPSPACPPFRFGDPAAARKLMAHVAAFVDAPGAAVDIAKVADAFRCLSRSDGLADHLQRVVLAPGPSRPDQAASIVLSIYETAGSKTGDSAVAAAVDFLRNRLPTPDVAPRVAAGLLSVLGAHEEASPNPHHYVAELRKSIRTVQKLHGLSTFVSVEDVQKKNLCSLFPLSASLPDPVQLQRKAEILLNSRCKRNPEYFSFLASLVSPPLASPSLSLASLSDIWCFLRSCGLLDKTQSESSWGCSELALVEIAECMIGRATRPAPSDPP